MKRFLIQLSCFLVLTAVSDLCVGKLLRYAEAHATGGDTERIFHINIRSNEDVLIFGSSRATNHYNTKILEDSLNSMVYNCGENETGIVCFYPKLNLIKQRYTPKAIIYDVYYVDLLDSLRIKNIDFLKTLKTSYGTTCVDSMFHRYESSTRYKMFSNMYRYNSSVASLLTDNFRTTGWWYYKGFYLLNTKKMENTPEVDNAHKHYSYDPEKIRLLELFIKENKDNIQLYFAISPEYGKTNDEMYNPIKQICKKYDIPLLNHLCDTTFTTHKELFSNQNHLNQDGAKLYSTMIVREIKNLTKDQD